ncbi:MAG TPA: FlgD immunoglobulin-like domain containing protein [Candidatus Krumholzibacteria bacterium]|nr:FlgD immunoglobulin-like domain containing protein [Candidatus Krumholzibacteria bacterium]
MRRLFPVSLLALALVFLSVVPATSQFCLASGTYTSTPPVSYNCALGLVTFNVTSWAISIQGSQITVHPNSSHVDPLVGVINCQTGSFTATKTIAGSCTETYTLTGQVQTAMSWTGTFQAQFTGAQCSAFTFDPCVSHSFPVSGALVATSVQPGATTPNFAWIDVAPNPFVTSTRLRVHVDERQFTRLVIRDAIGNEVATIVPGAWLGRGDYVYAWDGSTRDGRRAPSGIYFAHLHTHAVERVAKLVVLN